MDVAGDAVVAGGEGGGVVAVPPEASRHCDARGEASDQKRG
jgi:hypothetical protein